MKILLVDDARSVAQVMTSRLNSYGHEVVHAENGAQAVEIFPVLCPDLILMDIEMPVMNGFNAASGIRAIEAKQEWAWTPIIFLTSSDTVDNLVTAIEAGGDDFMSKFVPEPVLKAKMKAMTRIAGLRATLAVANARLQSLADHDGLTGLINRRSMDQKADAMWKTACERALSFGILMLDIDNFKKYNDHYGHQKGDDCLRSVATALGATLEQANAEGLTRDAFVARYGGEEFAVIMADVPHAEYAELAQRIVVAVRDLAIPHELNSHWGVTTMSVGGHRVDTAQGEIKHSFRAADANLYLAKEQGRNRAQV
jgi:diguanylate cyclase (GGDEF)-like protein